MKRIYIGVALLVLLAILGIALTVVFNRLHQPLSAKLEQASAAALEGDWEKATALAKDAGADWTRYRRFTAAVADHQPLEEMDSRFARLQVLTDQEDPDEFALCCAELSVLARAMGESQSIRWWCFF